MRTRQGEGQAWKDAVGIIGEQQQRRPVGDDTELPTGGTEAPGARSRADRARPIGTSWGILAAGLSLSVALLVSSAVAVAEKTTSSADSEDGTLSDLQLLEAGARTKDSGNMVQLRMAAGGLAILCCGALVMSATKTCPALDGRLYPLIKPYGPIFSCMFVVFVQLVQVFLFCLDRYGGLRIYSSFYGILWTWYIDLSLAVDALRIVCTLSWQKVATGTGSKRTTSVCLPFHAGGAVGVFGSATLLIVFALFCESTNRLRAHAYSGIQSETFV